MHARGAAAANGRVLIVDDDLDIREALGEVLTAESYDVETAENGEEALALIRRGSPPTVILLDLMMPVMDGVQFREEQLRDPVLSRIPVILITAGGDARVKADRLGITYALDKPLDIEELLTALRRYH